MTHPSLLNPFNAHQHQHQEPAKSFSRRAAPATRATPVCSNCQSDDIIGHATVQWSATFPFADFSTSAKRATVAGVYGIVLSGEITALMDDGEVLLKAGDVLIQRGTNHAWSNRTAEPAVVAFVLIDAEPV